jgi:Spy/CpxP family protein refolding chaperone
MISWKVILATVVIFGAGVLTGGLLVNYVDNQHRDHARSLFERGNPHPQMEGKGQPHPGDLSRPRSPEMWRKDFLGHLDEALKLTPEQRAAISKIIAEGQERNREIWTNVVPKMRQEMEQVHQRIRAELTPEQQKEFEALVRQFTPHGPARVKSPSTPPPVTNNVPTPPPGAPGV